MFDVLGYVSTYNQFWKWPSTYNKSDI